MTTLQRNRSANWWNPSGWISGGIVALLVMGWGKRLVFLGAMVVAVLGILSLAGHSLKGWSIHGWGSGNLPVSAAERAPLFAQAWAANDRAGMIQFIQPGDQSKLQAWLAANPVPSPVAEIPAADRQLKTISVQKDDLDGAIVKVQIASQTAAADPKASGVYTQRQTWAFSGGQWFFLPAASSSAVASPQAVAARPANPEPSTTAYRVASPARRSDPDDDERPPPRPAGRPLGNVVIPSTVPPWLRTR